MQETVKWPKVSIVIATYNMAHLIQETIWSCLWQKYSNLEIIVYDDCSTDGTDKIDWKFFGVKYVRGEKNLGVGDGFNAGIKHATGDIIVLMCADDLFTNDWVIFDYACCFIRWPGCGVVVRYYFQFIDGDKDMHPVRAWRTDNPVMQGNNPSGLAFRRQAIQGLKLSNRMMIESAYLVKAVTLDLWGWSILKYDTIAARVHKSTSQTPGYWLKRRVSSPVMDWLPLAGRIILRDYSSFIQIKCAFNMSAVREEIWNFIRLRPINLIRPDFWLFLLVVICVPRSILARIPPWYRRNIGRRITRQIKRPICA